MKAQLLTAFGGTEHFKWTDVPDPTAGPGQVRVRVRAIGINALEWKVRKGVFEAQPPTCLPFILGREFAGIVDGLGERATTGST